VVAGRGSAVEDPVGKDIMAWVGQEKLNKAIVAELVSDASLVTLTEHSATVLHIGRDTPLVKGRTPFLGVRVASSVPLVGVEVTKLQNATVEFRAIGEGAAGELTAIKIADRLEELLHAADNNRSYWDPSDTAVRCYGSRFLSRAGQMYDEDTDTWEVLVRAALIWIGVPCPVA